MRSCNLPSFNRNGTQSPLSTSKVHSHAQKLPGHTSESKSLVGLSTLLAQQGCMAIWDRPTTVPRRWVLLDLPRPLLLRAQNTTSSRPPSHRYAVRIHLAEDHQLTQTAQVAASAMTETVMPPELLAGIKASPTRSRAAAFADTLRHSRNTSCPWSQR